MERYDQTMEALDQGTEELGGIDSIASIETDVLTYLYEWYPRDVAEEMFADWHLRYASGT